MCLTLGYPVWKKFIDTPDGYIIQIFRIPGKRNETIAEALDKVHKEREPLLFMHGILSSSESFLINGPDSSPAFLLADTGKYDIWFMNARGNSYSKNHNFYESSISVDYW